MEPMALRAAERRARAALQNAEQVADHQEDPEITAVAALRIANLALRIAAQRVRVERNAFLARMTENVCERSMSLESAERDLDKLLDALDTLDPLDAPKDMSPQPLIALLDAKDGR